MKKNFERVLHVGVRELGMVVKHWAVEPGTARFKRRKREKHVYQCHTLGRPCGGGASVSCNMSH